MLPGQFIKPAFRRLSKPKVVFVYGKDSVTQNRIVKPIRQSNFDRGELAVFFDDFPAFDQTKFLGNFLPVRFDVGLYQCSVQPFQAFLKLLVLHAA